MNRPDDPLPSTIFIRKAGPEGQAEKFIPAPAPKAEATSLKELTPEQRKKIAAEADEANFQKLEKELKQKLA